MKKMIVSEVEKSNVDLNLPPDLIMEVEGSNPIAIVESGKDLVEEVEGLNPDDQSRVEEVEDLGRTRIRILLRKTLFL